LTSRKQRRSAFDSWSPIGETPAIPPAPIDLMSAKKRKRDRKWEKEHRTCSYRGVPQYLHQQVIALASQLQVNTDEVVQVFVKYGLSCLEQEILTISPHPKAQRMTLFPLPDGWGQQAGWTEVGKWTPVQKKEIPIKKVTAKKPQNSWEIRVHYRLPADAHEAIKQIAEEHTLPIGEVMTLFLKHGLESYKSGKLALIPHPKAVKMTLAEAST